MRTLFRMPDLLSIGLGGGSHVSLEPLSVGPVSVGYRLTQDALAFGGSQLTATDIGIAAGLIAIGDPGKVTHLDRAICVRVLDHIRGLVEESVDRMKTEAADVFLLAVGGGAFLIPNRLEGVSRVVRLPHGDCANAVGAAIAQVAGEVDQVFRDMTREAALAAAEKLAAERAVAAGADPATQDRIADHAVSFLQCRRARAHELIAGCLSISHPPEPTLSWLRRSRAAWRSTPGRATPQTNLSKGAILKLAPMTRRRA